jgi:hypothetical protein
LAIGDHLDGVLLPDLLEDAGRGERDKEAQPEEEAERAGGGGLVL